MKHLLNLIIRSLIRQKRFLIFSMVSLGLCLSLFVLTASYYAYEISCDKYQSNYKRIYRLVNTSKKKVRLDEQYYNTLLSGVSGIDKVCRVNIFGSMLTSPDGNVQNVNNLIIADSTYFDLFDYRILTGSRQHLLDAPNKIVLSKSLSEKLFGQQDPYGKSVRINMVTTAFVSGVFDDIKKKSHFNSDAVVSLYTDNLPWSGGNFGNQNGTWKVRLFSYYLLTAENADTASLAAQLKSTYQYPWYDYAPNIVMQPLSDIFTNNDFGDERFNHINKPLMWLLFSITLIVMIIAGVNYINLSLSNLKPVSKRVSILKVNGARRINIFRYYMVTAGLVIAVSFGIAIFLSVYLLPFFNKLTGTQMHLNVLAGNFHIVMVGIVLMILFFAIGLYPAWMFSEIKPVSLFQGKIAGNLPLNSFSRVILIFQFTAAIVLITSVLMIFKQIGYMKNNNPGFETEYLIKQNVHYSVKNIQTIKTYAGELLKNPHVLQLTLSDGVPFDIHSSSNQEINGLNVRYSHIDCDTAFFDVLKIKQVAGRTFLSSDPANVCIISEKLARDCGFDDPLNEKIGDNQIIGLMADLNSTSMHQQIDGVMFRPVGDYISNITLRITGTNIPQTISYIENSWKIFFPEYPFNYHFYDDLISQQYDKEQKLAESISIISGLAILICCLGLLGLVLNRVENRIKEIGIRKVNGAKVAEILSMLNRDFIKWVIVAFIIAIPITWYAMKKWLDHFAYKTTLDWWVFSLAGLLVLVIVLLTVSWQSWSVVNRNPAEALRYE